MTTDLNSRLHQDRLAFATLALMANGPCVAQLPAVAPLPWTERLMAQSFPPSSVEGFCTGSIGLPFFRGETK